MTPLRVGACLSLSGRFAQFGRQAVVALELWRDMDGNAELVVEDDESDPDRLESVIGAVASRSDILLGPYSTQLVRRAGHVAADAGWLLWNHGGSGDDVEAAQPGHVVSVLTPTSRYAQPFLDRLASSGVTGTLWVRYGKGRFGRQVAHGAHEIAEQIGMENVIAGPGDEFDPGASWLLLSAGTFEDDVEIVQQALDMQHPPRLVCSVAAGVQSFARALGRDATGTFGVGQWFPGAERRTPLLGPDERTFVSAYWRAVGRTPDYPAAQAIAAAVVASHCTRLAGGTNRELVWPVATDLVTTTLFGDFSVDARTGVQIKHEPVLVRWSPAGLTPA